MKRFFSLFLILNIFLCYSGFRMDAFASGDPAHVPAATGCHSAGHENKEDKAPDKEITSNNSESQANPCCLTSLLNSTIDHSVSAEPVIVDTITVTALNNEIGRCMKSMDDALNGHSPPDLQISNSTFLL